MRLIKASYTGDLKSMKNIAFCDRNFSKWWADIKVPNKIKYNLWDICIFIKQYIQTVQQILYVCM